MNAVLSLAEHTKQVAAGLMILKARGFADKMCVYCNILLTILGILRQAIISHAFISALV